MKARDYLKVIRRKWPVIVACALAAGLVMWVVTPAQPPPVQRVNQYSATATLLVSGASSLDRAALFITTGEVPRRAAEQVGFEQDPALLASQMRITPNAAAQSMTLNMSGGDPDYVTEVANAFAEQAVAYFAEAPVEVGGVSLSLLQEATPIPVLASGGFSIPPSRPFRTVLATLLGLLIGFGLSLVLHQFDSRLRSRDEVYEALRMPVIAEVPKMNRSERETARILVADEPHGIYADGYRTARAAVMHTASRDAALFGSAATAPETAGTTGTAKVVLITSAQAGEGKTTSIANLAASFAETGRSVLVLDADLRSPDLHLLFDVPQGAGISDFLYDPSSTQLSALARPTSVAGVRIITAGTQLAHPASLATRMGVLIEQSRSLADVILVDTSPLLAASDVFDLLPIVDTVLFVVRSGRLTEGAAQRVSELLGRFHVPVTGAILVAAPSDKARGYGYGYGYGYGQGTGSEGRSSRRRGGSKKRGSDGAARRPALPAPSMTPPRHDDDAVLDEAQPAGEAGEVQGFDPYQGYAPERDIAMSDGPDEPMRTRRERRTSPR